MTSAVTAMAIARRLQGQIAAAQSRADVIGCTKRHVALLPTCAERAACCAGVLEGLATRQQGVTHRVAAWVAALGVVQCAETLVARPPARTHVVRQLAETLHRLPGSWVAAMGLLLLPVAKWKHTRAERSSLLGQCGASMRFMLIVAVEKSGPPLALQQAVGAFSKSLSPGQKKTLLPALNRRSLWSSATVLLADLLADGVSMESLCVSVSLTASQCPLELYRAAAPSGPSCQSETAASVRDQYFDMLRWRSRPTDAHDAVCRIVGPSLPAADDGRLAASPAVAPLPPLRCSAPSRAAPWAAWATAFAAFPALETDGAPHRGGWGAARTLFHQLRDIPSSLDRWRVALQLAAWQRSRSPTLSNRPPPPPSALLAMSMSMLRDRPAVETWRDALHFSIQACTQDFRLLDRPEAERRSAVRVLLVSLRCRLGTKWTASLDEADIWSSLLRSVHPPESALWSFDDVCACSRIGYFRFKSHLSTTTSPGWVGALARFAALVSDLRSNEVRDVTLPNDVRHELLARAMSHVQ